MRYFFLSGLLLIGLLMPANLLSQEAGREIDEISPMELTLKEYRDRGYKILGPFQYLGRSDGRIKLFRHGLVPYGIMDMIDEAGENIRLDQYEFVYVLSKDGHIVLLRVAKEVRDNV